MKRHTIIEINRFTNFLKVGAFVRRQGIWTLLFDRADGYSPGVFSSVGTDFITSRTTRKHYRNQWDMSNQDFDQAVDQALGNFEMDREKIIIDWSDVDKSSFEKAFELTQNAFALGEVKKIVPIACQKGKLREALTPRRKLEFLKKLSQMPSRLYPYGEWSESGGFMGASPEIFLELDQLDIQTMALAGTSSKDVTVEDFLSDPKERKEHQFVVDDIMEQLGSLAQVRSEETSVVQFPFLNHLETKVSARLFVKTSLDDLIKKLHPTSALGIYPRNEYFKKFVQFPFQSERGSFGAPWGFETLNKAFLLVAIRKWDWSDRDVTIYAGCGVVPESALEKEFAEILKKIDSVKRIFF